MEQEWGSGLKDNRLFKELNEWNKLAEEIRIAFGKDTVNDKAFYKLKLKEYERLNDHYSRRKDLTKDERAFLIIHRAKCNSIRKMVYPGWISRLLHRAGSLLRQAASRYWNAAQPGGSIYEQNPAAFFSVHTEDIITEQLPEQPEQKERYRPQLKYGPDLGGRKQEDKNLKQGPSI